MEIYYHKSVVNCKRLTIGVISSESDILNTSFAFDNLCTYNKNTFGANFCERTEGEGEREGGRKRTIFNEIHCKKS